MNLNSLTWRSLKTRVTVLTLFVFLIAIAMVAVYAHWTLRRDFLRVLGEKQLAHVSLVASELNHELSDRLKDLQAAARRITPSMISHPAEMQAFLDDRPALANRFNGGLFVMRQDGTAIAEVPRSANRVGLNYMNRDFIAASLREGKSMIGKPVMGKAYKVPLVGMNVPILDAQGQVIGALAGVLLMSRESFLTRYAEGPYGQAGGFTLMAPGHGLIVTGTDKTQVMQPIPGKGVDDMLDRYLQGFEGYGVSVNARGESMLSAAKALPVANWLLQVSLPVTEAFAPIADMLKRLLLTSLVASAICAGLIWWLLRRELLPLASTSRALAAATAFKQAPTPLPIVRNDEIGELIASFNGMIETVNAHASALRESEARYERAVNGANDGIWEWSVDADTVYLSPRWKELLGYAADELPTDGLKSCFQHVHPDDLKRTEEAVRAHLEEGRPFQVEFRLRRKNGQYRWFYSRGKSLVTDCGTRLMAGSISDITQRKEVEQTLLATLKEKEALVREVHHRVKNNLQVITSLLRLESSRSASAAAKTALNDMTGRIRSMALLHESLHRSGNLASVDLSAYLKQLATQAFRTQLSSATIELQLGLDSVRVGMDQASCCGLIVNELISNCLKHAFPDGRSGEVRVALTTRVAANKLSLSVADNGIGLPGNFEDVRSTSLGLQLVSDLAKQLGGELEIGGGPGTTVSIVFAAASPDTDQVIQFHI